MATGRDNEDERKRRAAVLGRALGVLVALGGVWLLFVTSGDPDITENARRGDTMLGIVTLVVGSGLAWASHLRIQRLRGDG